jgi:hypothetical protein
MRLRVTVCFFNKSKCVLRHVARSSRAQSVVPCQCTRNENFVALGARLVAGAQRETRHPPRRRTALLGSTLPMHDTHRQIQIPGAIVVSQQMMKIGPAPLHVRVTV